MPHCSLDTSTLHIFFGWIHQPLCILESYILVVEKWRDTVQVMPAGMYPVQTGGSRSDAEWLTGWWCSLTSPELGRHPGWGHQVDLRRSGSSSLPGRQRSSARMPQDAIYANGGWWVGQWGFQPQEHQSNIWGLKWIELINEYKWCLVDDCFENDTNKMY